MKKKEFENYFSMVEYLLVLVDLLDYSVVAAKYEDAIILFNILTKYDDVIVKSCELFDPDWNSYGDEFYISLSYDEENDIIELTCETAKIEDKYLSTCAPVLLLFEDANSKIIGVNDESHIVEVCVDCFDEEEFLTEEDSD